MGPLIGITMAFDHGTNTAKLSAKYISAVEEAGGYPWPYRPSKIKSF